MSSEQQKTKAREYYWQHRKESRKTQKEYHMKRKISCPNCGNPMNPHSHICQKCYYAHLKQLRATQNPHWKGGAYTRPDGYVAVIAPNHPRASANNGYVLEHIIIWEIAHNKPLPKGWVIHHLNGIKNDNRIANLVALSNRKHRTILAVKAERIQELEGLLNNQHQLL